MYKKQISLIKNMFSLTFYQDSMKYKYLNSIKLLFRFTIKLFVGKMKFYKWKFHRQIRVKNLISIKLDSLLSIKLPITSMYKLVNIIVN